VKGGARVGALFDTARQIEPWLTARGLKPEDINRGMSILLGDDWKRMGNDELRERLQANGHTLTQTMPYFADEIEALIRGAIKLEDFRTSFIDTLALRR